MKKTIWRVPISQLQRRREKLVLVGHNYVEDLKNLGKIRFNMNGREIFVDYVYSDGASYDTFLERKILFESVKEKNPDYVIVILASNSIASTKSQSTIQMECKLFYERLRYYLPDTVIISALAEMRYNNDDNSKGIEVPRDYPHRRNLMNKFLSYTIKEKDYFMMTGGNRGMVNHYREDGIHLNKKGLRLYTDFIRNILSYIHKDIQVRLDSERKYDLLMKRRKVK